MFVCSVPVLHMKSGGLSRCGVKSLNAGQRFIIRESPDAELFCIRLALTAGHTVYKSLCHTSLTTLTHPHLKLMLRFKVVRESNFNTECKRCDCRCPKASSCLNMHILDCGARWDEVG